MLHLRPQKMRRKAGVGLPRLNPVSLISRSAEENKSLKEEDQQGAGSAVVQAGHAAKHSGS